MDQKPQNDGLGHVLVVAYPLQGHTAPLLKLANRICKHGVKVTFVTTEFTLAKMASSMDKSEQEGKGIAFATVPDGLEPDDGRKEEGKLSASIRKVMPRHLEDLIRKTNDSDYCDGKFTGIIIDSTLAYMLDIPKKFGVKCATYWCSTPGNLALGFNCQKLIEAKIIDANDGTLMKNEKIQLLPNMPPMGPDEINWRFPRDLNLQKSMFHYYQSLTSDMISKSDLILCNWFNELFEPSASNLSSNILPIGPLLADGQSAGSFASEDSTCISWLDRQSLDSVVYVAFGSTSRFTQEQINEIALGLELLDRPFLWVAWLGLANGVPITFPDGFTERVANRGKIVEWAPQERVLAHPSVGCFISHCGWGSTMESISMGIPFLCWPYFADQFYARTLICEAWKVGLRLNAGENGILSKEEIRQKVDLLFSETGFRSNVLKLKELARNSLTEGGSSYKNMEFFLSQIKY